MATVLRLIAPVQMDLNSPPSPPKPLAMETGGCGNYPNRVLHQEEGFTGNLLWACDFLTPQGFQYPLRKVLSCKRGVKVPRERIVSTGTELSFHSPRPVSMILNIDVSKQWGWVPALST